MMYPYMTLSDDIEIVHSEFLDQGIDDMEAGRELPLDLAFKKISELRRADRILSPDK